MTVPEVLQLLAVVTLFCLCGCSCCCDGEGQTSLSEELSGVMMWFLQQRTELIRSQRGIVAVGDGPSGCSTQRLSLICRSCNVFKASTTLKQPDISVATGNHGAVSRRKTDSSPTRLKVKQVQTHALLPALVSTLQRHTHAGGGTDCG